MGTHFIVTIRLHSIFIHSPTSHSVAFSLDSCFSDTSKYLNNSFFHRHSGRFFFLFRHDNSSISVLTATLIFGAVFFALTNSVVASFFLSVSLFPSNVFLFLSQLFLSLSLCRLYFEYSLFPPTPKRISRRCRTKKRKFN